MSTGTSATMQTGMAKSFRILTMKRSRVTDTSAILVGNRLHDLMKNGVKLIPFEGDGVHVRVPVEVVKDWNIKAEDRLSTDISWDGK